MRLDDDAVAAATTAPHSQTMKPKFVVLGSSHAVRLLQAFKKNALFDQHEILDYTCPGAQFAETRLPDENIFTNPDDILFMQIFGEDIFEKFIKNKL